MAKYEKPEINIVKFNIENIVTQSSVLTNMVDSGTQVKVVSYNNVIAKEE